MSLHHGLPSLPLGEVALAIGSFDGVHRSHHAVLEPLVFSSLPAVVVTFEPHPRCVLDPANCPKSLTTIDEKADLLHRAGIDEVVALGFTAELAAMTPEAFFAHLGGRMTVRRLVCGPDFAFGKARTGDVEWLATNAARLGFEVEVIAPFESDGQELHSSDIRRLLTESGDVARAAALLGRTYTLRGTVEHGAEVGRAIGFPTANLALPLNKLVPRPGIYAGRVAGAGPQPALGALSIGYRPTFGGDRLAVEVYVLDFAGDLYGRQLEVSVEHRLRDEVRYDSAAELAGQIALDVAEVRRLLQ